MVRQLLHNELEKLKKRILSVGIMVEDRIRKAAVAIENCDAELAEEIILGDSEIDEAEVEVEEESLKILALYQPVASDLRFIIAVIKINNDLERIADQAVNIAQRVQTISASGLNEVSYDFSDMVEKASYMLKKTLDAFINLDSEQARAVCAMDEEVDEIKDKVYDYVKDLLKGTQKEAGAYINTLLISRHLERIADHATNISEEIIHMVEGGIVRHDPRI